MSYSFCRDSVVRWALTGLMVAAVMLVHPVVAGWQSGRPRQIPQTAIEVANLQIPDAMAWTEENRLFLVLKSLPADAIVSIPRLANSIRSITWHESPNQQLNLKPEPERWLIQLGSHPQTETPIIVVELDGPLTLMAADLIDRPNQQGIIRLPASHAITHGKNLRYEPQPHKNTVGYWSNEKDTVEWKIEFTAPGRYEVDVLQGCGKGHGGSEVRVLIGEHSLPMTVQETGHFQNFIWRNIGTVEIGDAGLRTLRIVPTRKIAGAVMDVREVRLVPVGAGTDRNFEPQLIDPAALPDVQ